MRVKYLGFAFAVVASITGCTSGWIEEPSQATLNLVNDLKLEGFSCAAGFSAITCRQIDAYVEKSNKICSAEKGCIKQPCHDVRVVYSIKQQPGGLPAVDQTMERTVTKKIEKNSSYSAERTNDLEEFCAID
ncbi:hypothetical protein ABH908_000504 [Pseudomonas frederiksbergensis]|uniref:hypothetical protein n=1 Tax=Pseudomonas TaxID=286 RepID=UPI003D1EF2D1